MFEQLDQPHQAGGEVVGVKKSSGKEWRGWGGVKVSFMIQENITLRYNRPWKKKKWEAAVEKVSWCDF